MGDTPATRATSLSVTLVLFENNESEPSCADSSSMEGGERCLVCFIVQEEVGAAPVAASAHDSAIKNELTTANGEA